MLPAEVCASRVNSEEPPLERRIVAEAVGSFFYSPA
jgi:hypothetical protein